MNKKDNKVLSVAYVLIANVLGVIGCIIEDLPFILIPFLAFAFMLIGRHVLGLFFDRK